MIEILSEIAKVGPLVGLLVACIIYFVKKENKDKTAYTTKETEYKEQIQKLNNALRQEGLDNFKLLSKLTETIDKLGDSYQDVSGELNSLKNMVEVKLEQLKNKLEK